MSRIDIRAQRRSQILEATRQLVAEQGWQNTTFADICRAAGISNGVLTYHFKNKEEIRFALFELELLRWKKEFRDAEEFAGELVAEQRVRFALERTRRTIEEEPEFYQTLAYYLGNIPIVRPEYADRIRLFFTEIREHIAETLQSGCGAFSREDALEMAAVIQTIVYGYAFTRTMIGAEAPIDDLVELATSYITTRKQRHETVSLSTPRR